MTRRELTRILKTIPDDAPIGIAFVSGVEDGDIDHHNYPIDRVIDGGYNNITIVLDDTDAKNRNS